MRHPAPLEFNNLDRVDKIGGTQERFTNGKVLSVFQVRSGSIRYVVEAESGELFICSAKCLQNTKLP